MAQNKQLVEERKKHLIQMDGYPFNPEAPKNAHGRSVGYMSWSCRCDLCRAWNSKRARGRTPEAGLEPEDRSQTVALSVMLSLAEFDQIRLQARRAGKSLADYVVMAAYHFQAPSHEAEEVELAPALAEPVEPVAEPVAETVPEPEIAVKPREEPPLSTEEVPLIPPMSPAVRNMIRDIGDLRELSDTYHSPDWSAPTGFEQRERRARGTHEIIVGGDQRIIYWRRDRELGSGESELLTAKPKALPKAKGGGSGTKMHTTTKALIDALKAAGAEVTVGGSGHYIVKKDGKTTTIPMTPSDHRSLKNSNAQVRRAGLLEGE